MPFRTDDKLRIMPTFERRKVKRLDYTGKGLKIDVLDIVKGMMESVITNTPFQVYLNKDMKFVFTLNDDMTLIYHKDDFVEDWVEYWDTPSDYALYKTWDDYFLSDHFNKRLNKTIKDFQMSDVEVLNLDQLKND